MSVQEEKRGEVMKYWKLVLFLLVAAILAIAVHLCMGSPWPYAVRTFEYSNEGWYGQGVHCFPNNNGEMMCMWREGYYIYTSNTVTGAWSKKPVEVK